MQVIDSYDVHSNLSVEPTAHLATAAGEKSMRPPVAVPGGLAKTIADRAADYRGPVRSETGKTLWAIQAWYVEVGDQTAVDEVLASHDRSTAASH
jgi:hypothetical protein